MSSGRAKQLADRIAVIVAELLERRIKDPRLGFVTVTDARLTGDLREANVFYTVLGDAEARDASAAALASARGMIRTEVGRQLGLRHAPTIDFHLDAVPEDASHIEELLAAARLSDAEVAARAAGAQPAGEADPYRKPREDDELEGELEGGQDGEPDGDTDSGVNGGVTGGGEAAGGRSGAAGA